MSASSLLFAEGTTRTMFEFGRVQSTVDWILPFLALCGIVVFVILMYIRDARELNPVLTLLLMVLRVATFLGLLILYLQPQWRTEREVTRNSRVLVLMDTSSSMGLTDIGSSAASGGTTRAQHVAAALGKGDFLQEVRKTHDLVVLRFAGGDPERLASLDKLVPGQASEGDPLDDGTPATAENPEGGNGDSDDSDPAHDEKIDWEKAFTPTGTETRLGQALQKLIYDERSAPVSGVVVFSDGGHNAGPPPEAAIEVAQETKIPIFPVGIGSKRKPVNVTVHKLEAPAQTHPGDPYSVTGLIRSQGLIGEAVTVELLIRDADQDANASKPGAGILVDRQEIILGEDGEVVPVKFQLTPRDTGRRVLCLRVRPHKADRDPSDDFQEEEIDVVDRKTRVLLFAGGPTREYRFLRTQLYRDASATVDVLLQTSRPGISQEADEILDVFPATRDEMFAYDCVVAFDPDWQRLGEDGLELEERVKLVEEWVAEQGGGLIVIAGSVFAGESVSGWIQNPDLAKIRALYPVEFQRRLSAFESGSYVAEQSWPLDFTREGLEAEFLWLDDTVTASQQAWAGFAGVFSHFPVRGPKAGATVLARFSDPRAGHGEEQPVYFAEQFYGSGRVFYLGSGEMWRLRGVDETYFERLYTNLIRHVSQGRLLRQSSRGALMIGQDRCLLGHTVEIRAQLTDAQLAPLMVPGVSLEVILPDNSLQSVTLQPDPSRDGMYAGQLTVLQQGVYRLELPIPESNDERITRRLKVRLPDLERENPQRNDKLLSRIAEGSGGKYYERLETALNTAALDPLVGRLKDRTKTIILTAAPDPLWKQTWLKWMMLILCGLLCLEWLIRRLLRLA